MYVSNRGKMCICLHRPKNHLDIYQQLVEESVFGTELAKFIGDSFSFRTLSLLMNKFFSFYIHNFLNYFSLLLKISSKLIFHGLHINNLPCIKNEFKRL